uniref:Uncharacterized protein n=1 Tax=Ornithorhynchus anatinus TaxID=9258 RepID=A0A6I8NA17_ORNAN
APAAFQRHRLPAASGSPAPNHRPARGSRDGRGAGGGARNVLLRGARAPIGTGRDGGAADCQKPAEGGAWEPLYSPEAEIRECGSRACPSDVRRKACSALWGPLASLLLFTMPAGVSWSNYLKMLSATMLTMLAGAEVVHRYYRPDLTIPENPPKPGELRTELLGLKERQDEVQISQQR